MVDEVISLKSISDLGVSLLVILVVLYAFVKLIPNWIKVWQSQKESEQKHRDEEQRSMQEYYNERNKAYQQQMEIMNRQSEQQSNLIGQATQVIARSNEVIAGNTEALKQNSAMHERVLTALSYDLEATRSMSNQLKDHDDRSQKIYTNIQRLLDKSS